MELKTNNIIIKENKNNSSKYLKGIINKSDDDSILENVNSEEKIEYFTE